MEAVRVVTSKPGVTACKVNMFKGKVIETKFEPFYLGKISDATEKNAIEEGRILNVKKAINS